MNKSTRISLTSAQLRAGRALIRWSAEDLARASAVGLTTIRRAELTDSETSMTAANDLAVRHALEAAGVEFIDENGGGAGVRLRTPSGKGSKKTGGLGPQRDDNAICKTNPILPNKYKYLKISGREIHGGLQTLSRIEMGGKAYGPK